MLFTVVLLCSGASSGGKDRKAAASSGAGTPVGPVSIADVKANFGRFQKAGKGVMNGLAFAATAATGAEGDAAASSGRLHPYHRNSFSLVRMSLCLQGC